MQVLLLGRELAEPQVGVAELVLPAGPPDGVGVRACPAAVAGGGVGGTPSTSSRAVKNRTASA